MVFVYGHGIPTRQSVEDEDIFPVTVYFRVTDRSIPDFEASLTEVTNAQFAAFLMATGRGSDSWFDTYGAERGDFPARGMCKDDATAYVRWLSFTARQSGRIKSNQQYQLPTDLQFTALAGGQPSLELKDGTPEMRMVQAAPTGIYLTGTTQLPDPTEGNTLRLETPRPGAEPPAGLPGNDGYAGVAPVGLFKSKSHVVYDLAGNVEEYIRDSYNPAHPVCVRGGSYESRDMYTFAMSHRNGFPDKKAGLPARGFRIVLETLDAKGTLTSVLGAN